MQVAGQPPDAASALKQAILKYIRTHSGCTFAALVRDVPDCAGTCVVGSAFVNVILWSGLSREAVEALFALEKEKAIGFEPCEVEDYGELRLKLPEVEELEDQKDACWLPILIRARRKR